jgi:hypothetical protein
VPHTIKEMMSLLGEAATQAWPECTPQPLLAALPALKRIALLYVVAAAFEVLFGSVKTAFCRCAWPSPQLLGHVPVHLLQQTSRIAQYHEDLPISFCNHNEHSLCCCTLPGALHRAQQQPCPSALQQGRWAGREALSFTCVAVQLAQTRCHARD